MLENRRLSQETAIKEWNQDQTLEKDPTSHQESLGSRMCIGLGFFFIWMVVFGIYWHGSADKEACGPSVLLSWAGVNFLINTFNSILILAVTPALVFYTEKNLKKQTLIYSYYSKTDYRLKYISIILRAIRFGTIISFFISFLGTIYAYAQDEECSSLRSATLLYLICCSLLLIITLFYSGLQIYEQQKLHKSAQFALKYYNVK